MNDIVDYSKKLNEETHKLKKIFIFIIILVLIFSFSIGFYVSYSIKSKNDGGEARNKFETVYDILKDEWYYGIEDENIDETLLDKAITGMLDTEKDPYTRYLLDLGSLSDTYTGLGITVSKYKEYFLIKEVASKVNLDSGLKVGDILKKIDDTDLANKEITDIKTLIENKNQVTLTIERNGIEQNIIGYITTYSPVTVFSDLTLSTSMAYIQITEFDLNTASEFDKALKEAKDNNYQNLILDLRDNPGGYINTVVECADLLMGSGKTVITTTNKKGNSYSYKTTNSDKYDFNKIIVLINENSASGAEALSAALNENMNDTVILYGKTTYGKGSAQKTITFSDGTYFHYTYALWYTPNGNSINKVGVSAEVNYIGSGLYLNTLTENYTELYDYGDSVKNLQIIMKELGYYTGNITSYYDENLVNSVKAFQTSEGIEETGKFDALTFRYLLAKYMDSETLDYHNEVMKVVNDYAA